MSDIREAAKTALQQWKMYAEFEERDLASENSPEGDMFRTVRAALADDGWRDISTLPYFHENRRVWHWGGPWKTPELRRADREWWKQERFHPELRPTHWHPEYVPTPPEPKS